MCIYVTHKSHGYGGSDNPEFFSEFFVLGFFLLDVSHVDDVFVVDDSCVIHNDTSFRYWFSFDDLILPHLRKNCCSLS